MVPQNQNTGLISVGESFVQFLNVGDMVVGDYLGSQPIRYADGSYGQQHFINTPDGGVTKFLGSYNLDIGLGMVQPGAYTEITYIGEEPTRRGLNPVRKFKIEAAAVLPAMPTPEGGPPPAPLSSSPQTTIPVGNQNSGRPPYPQPPIQNPVGGMPAHTAAPAANVVAAAQNGMAVSDVPFAYTPDGVAIHGYTPDGTPLDSNGMLIGV